MEQIINFIEKYLPDIIAFVLIFSQYFQYFIVKKGVKKDNIFTQAVVKSNIEKVSKEFKETKQSLKSVTDSSARELEGAKSELKVAYGHLKKASEENVRLGNEVDTLYSAIKIIATSNKDMIQNGYSTEIGKILELYEERKLKKESE